MPLETWHTVKAQEAERLAAELRREIAPAHVLAGRRVTVVRRCFGCDDVIFRMDGEVFAVVHLTWSGQREEAPWPHTVILPTFLALESFVDSHHH